MAKKNKNNETAEKKSITKFFAFWAMAISAIMYIFGGIINIIINGIKDLGGTELGKTLSSLSGVAVFFGNIALIIAIAVPAHGYVKGKKQGWKLFYWIALAVFVLGVVFGLVSSFI